MNTCAGDATLLAATTKDIIDDMQSLIEDNMRHGAYVASYIIDAFEEANKLYNSLLEASKTHDWHAAGLPSIAGIDNMLQGFLDIKKVLKSQLRYHKRKLTQNTDITVTREQKMLDSTIGLIADKEEQNNG